MKIVLVKSDKTVKSAPMQTTHPVKMSNMVAAHTGVQAFRLIKTGVRVWLADGTTVKISKAKMPPVEKLSAFTIADVLQLR